MDQHHRLQTSSLLLMCLFTLNAYAADSKIKSPEDIPGSLKVDAEHLIELAGSIDDLVIIDSRINADRHQGYIEGSISLPDTNTDCDSLSFYLKTTETPVLFYCNGPKCGRSGKAVKIALSCDYKKIYWFRGGFEEWKNKKYTFAKE